MYLICKCGQFLVEASEYSQTWIKAEVLAMVFHDHGEARALAERLEASVVLGALN